MLDNVNEIEEFLICKVNTNLEEYGLNKKVSWDMVRGDCPLGWDVSVYFKQGYLTGDTVKKVITTIYNSITNKNDFDFSYCEIEFNNDWLKYSFQADLINS